MKEFIVSLKIAAVFIGTVVGAGLASGQEIIQFFTIYGFKGMIGIIICGILYMITGIITIDLSYKYKAASYKDLIYLSCGKYLGAVIDSFTSFFLFGGACIILAGSGAIFNEFLGLPGIAGIILMALCTAVVVLHSTDGLVFINSIIVPCMITIIIMVSILVISNKSSASYGVMYDLYNSPILKTSWFSSCLLYTSFNMLFATGVLSPLTRDIKRSRGVYMGIVLGAIGLLVLSILINTVLILNQPGIFNVSIPMLFIANNLGKVITIILSIIIWCEMFSTEVSDIYSLAKKIHHNFNINYKLSVILIILLCLPFTNLGFANLIKLLYPPFGFVSLIYIICLIRLYYKSKK
jgi:uncharacterized membrane protein YkvI